MAFGQSAFITLIDAFLSVKTVKDVDNLDLNERVKRIVKERLAEFNIWLGESESELRKRYEIEKSYLRGLKFHFVDTVDQVLKIALMKDKVDNPLHFEFTEAKQS